MQDATHPFIAVFFFGDASSPLYRQNSGMDFFFCLVDKSRGVYFGIIILIISYGKKMKLLQTTAPLYEYHDLGHFPDDRGSATGTINSSSSSSSSGVSDCMCSLISPLRTAAHFAFSIFFWSTTKSLLCVLRREGNRENASHSGKNSAFLWILYNTSNQTHKRNMLSC